MTKEPSDEDRVILRDPGGSGPPGALPPPVIPRDFYKELEVGEPELSE